MHLKSKHFSCTRWTEFRFLGSGGYFVLQQQFYRRRRGSDVIYWGWICVTWGGGAQAGAAGSAHRGSFRFSVSTKLESEDGGVQGEGCFDEEFPHNSRTQSRPLLPPLPAVSFLISPHLIIMSGVRWWLCGRLVSYKQWVFLPSWSPSSDTSHACSSFFFTPFYRQQLTPNSSQPFSRAWRRETRVWSNAEGHD